MEVKSNSRTTSSIPSSSGVKPEDTDFMKNVKTLKRDFLTTPTKNTPPGTSDSSVINEESNVGDPHTPATSMPVSKNQGDAEHVSVEAPEQIAQVIPTAGSNVTNREIAEDKETNDVRIIEKLPQQTSMVASDSFSQNNVISENHAQIPFSAPDYTDVLTKARAADPVFAPLTGDVFSPVPVYLSYPIPFEDYNNVPIYNINNSIGSSSQVFKTSSFTEPSNALVVGETVQLSSYLQIQSYVSSLPYFSSVGMTQNFVQHISKCAFSAAAFFVNNFSTTQYSNTLGVNISLNTVGSDVLGNRRYIDTDSVSNSRPRNGYPLIGADSLSGAPRESIINEFTNNTNEEHRAQLGVIDSSHSLNARTVKIKSLELIPSSVAYIKATAHALSTTRSMDRLRHVSDCIFPSNVHGQIVWPEMMGGPSVRIEPYITDEAVNMQQLLLGGSKRHFDAAYAVAQMIARVPQPFINTDRLEKLKRVLSNIGKADSIISQFRGFDETYMTDLAYMSVAPNLFDLQASALNVPTSGPNMIAPLMDILALYTFYPEIAHKADDVFIYHIASCLNSLTAGRDFLRAHRYSNRDAVPKLVERNQFYTPDYLPTLLQARPVNLSPLMQAVFQIIQQDGDPLDNDRPWDNAQKPIYGSFPYADFANAQARTLEARINSLEAFWLLVIDDVSLRNWMKTDKLSLISMWNEISIRAQLSVNPAHMALGYITRALSRLPTTNAPRMRFYDPDGAHVHPTYIQRNGKPTPGYRRTVKYQPGTGLSLLAGFDSRMFNETGSLEGTFNLNQSEYKQIFIAAAGLITEGQRACFAFGISQMTAESIQHATERVSPIDRAAMTRNWVTPQMRAICADPENAEFIAATTDSFDFLTNPVYSQQVVVSRPQPSAIHSYIVLAVNEMYESHYADLITTTDGTRTGVFIRDGALSYTVGTTDENTYVSPNVKAMAASVMNALAMCKWQFFEHLNPYAHVTQGIVFARTVPEIRDVFTQSETSFNWEDFISTGRYEKDGEPVTYRKVWLMRTSRDGAIDRIPADVTHVGTFRTGSTANATMNITITGNLRYGLYITEKERVVAGNATEEQWLPYNKNDNIILYMHSSALFYSDSEAAFKTLIRDCGSNDRYPGSFVAYDPVTLCSFDPSDYIGMSNNVANSDEFSFYFEHPLMCKLPPLPDDYMNPIQFITTEGQRYSQSVRIISPTRFQATLVAVRPGVGDWRIGAESYHAMRGFRKNFDALEFLAAYDDDVPQDAFTTTADEFGQPGTKRFCHLIEAYASASTQTFSDADFMSNST